MKFEFDDIGFKDEIELMNLQKQMGQNQINNKQTLCFNTDSLYNAITEDLNKKDK